MLFEGRGLMMGLDIPTGEMSPRVTCMPSVSKSCTEQGCRSCWKMVIYEDGHRRLKGWEVGHGGRYSRVLVDMFEV